jgi:hypothetical protein
MTSESGSQKVTAAAFRQATQARRSSTSLGSGSPLLLPTSSSTAQLVNVSSSMQDESRNGRTSIDSVFLLPPVGSSAPDARSQALTSMTRGRNGSSPMPSPTATSFRGAGEIRGERGKEIESPALSARMFIPPHTRLRSGVSDTLSSAAAVNNNSRNKGIGLARYQTLRV